MNMFRVAGTRNFRALFIGMSVSAFGDQLSLTTFIWLAYAVNHSAAAVAAIAIAYFAPLCVGGFLAGYTLDRFPRRVALIVDNSLRGVVFAAIAVAGFTGHFAMWMLFVGAGTYGFLRMISLAGVPTLIPGLVPEEDLGTANALEAVTFNLASVAGPVAAGILLARFGGFVAIGADAISYFFFVTCLLFVPVDLEVTPESGSRSVGLREAFSFIVGARAILATTLMFICYNIAGGALTVMLPIYVTNTIRGDATAYGYILGLNELGSLAVTLLVGSIRLPAGLPQSIAAVQILAGISILGLLATFLPAAYVSYFFFGFFSGPLTIWAQTLRMQRTPARMRGQVFALLRTLMMSAPPLGSALAGVAAVSSRQSALIAFIALLIASPAIVALVSPAFRADRSTAASA